MNDDDFFHPEMRKAEHRPAGWMPRIWVTRFLMVDGAACGGRKRWIFGEQVCIFAMWSKHFREPMRWQTLYEGRWIFGLLILFTLVSFLIFPWVGILFLGLILFSLYFFRDPVREIPDDPLAVVSAADGVVADIVEQEDGPFEDLPVRIGVFLSVFNVHVNRSPIEGSVVFTEEKNGKYLDARHPDASMMNAFRAWVIEGPERKVAVRQITGAIARRIVAWSKPGDSLAKGERFGMIRFGSRTEVFLPAGTKVLVAKGDRVEGGRTVIAEFSPKEES
ncbi:MAG: phosphatidylserine decarboxylase [Puniceicoccales bacterium]